MARGVLLGGALALALVAASGATARAQVPPPQLPDIPEVLTATNPPGQPVITPDQARAVTGVIWWLREASRSRKNPTWTTLLETGAAAELDAQWMRGELASTAADQTPRASENVSLAVPRQYLFPAFFIAHLDSSSAKTGNDRYSEFLVFTRSSVNDPWRLALETFTRDYDNEPLVLPRPDADGYVPPAPRPTLAAENVPRLLAEYWQHWNTDDAPPSGSPIAQTTEVTHRGHEIFNRTRVAGMALSDLRIVLPDRLVQDGVFEIDNPRGISLVCFSLHYAEVHSGSWWRPAGLHGSEPGEPPDGPYLQVQFPVLEQDCLSLNARDPSSSLTWIADQRNDEPRTAVPAPQPWLPIGAVGVGIMGAVTVLLLALRRGQSPVGPAAPTPLRQLGVDARVRSAGVALAAGLVFAQLETDLLLYVPLVGIVLAVLVAGWLARRLALRRRRAVTISAALEIPLTPDKIFDFVADLRNHLTWSPELEAVEPLTDGPSRVGSQYRFRQRLNDDRQIEFLTRVIDYQPGWRFETVIDDGLHHQTRTYTLRPVRGGTHVTSTLRVESGPLGAVAAEDSRLGGFKQFHHARLLERLERLRMMLTDPSGSPPPQGPPEGPPMKGPSLLKLTVVISLVTGVVTLSGWWPLTLICWVVEGYCLIIFIHEFAHFFEARRQGDHPDLPVVTNWIAAAVKLRPRPSTGVGLAQISAAGPVAGALAAAASLTLYARYPWSGFLWWAVGSSGIALANLYPTTEADGLKFLAPTARWFAPIGLVLGVGVYAILMLSGVSSVLIAVAVVIAVGARLAPVVRVPYLQASAPVGLAFGLCWLAVALYTGFVLVVGTNWLIPLS